VQQDPIRLGTHNENDLFLNMTTEEISKVFVERSDEPMLFNRGSKFVDMNRYNSNKREVVREAIWAGYLFLKYGDAKYTPTERLEP
jgi:hypothetical protein